MARIKCPNCGSTAQIERLYLDTSAETERTDDYACGCGCVFTVVYEVVSVDIQES